MARVQCICRTCGTAFLAYPSEIAHGYGKYCRAACGYASLRSTPETFWSKVGKSDGCWLWQGARSPQGYGRVTIAQTTWQAHRYAYTLAVGPIPLGLMVCHRCDNPPCVRPDHLFLGDAAVNNADRTTKGRGRTSPRRGASNKNAVLTDELVTTIRRRYATGGIGQRQLAAEYGVTQRTIAQVVHRRTWAHVS